MKPRVPEPGVIEDRELVEYYSFMAKRYMKISCKRFLRRIKAKGILQGRALDVGTGPGIFPIFLSRELPGIEFKGIDLSPVMIERAQKNAREEGLSEKIKFEIGSAYALPCEDHSLDLLLCINTLHHLDYPVVFFNEVARSLKEEGAFIIVDFRRDTSPLVIEILNFFWKLFFGKHPKAKNGFLESIYSSYTLEECRRFLEESQLKEWVLSTRTIEMWIESKKRYGNKS